MRSLALLLLFGSLTLFAQGGRGGPATPPPKNLKILPVDVNIMKVMGDIRAALGVQCNFCHGPAAAAQGGGAAGRGPAPPIDFASDENPHKLIARNMMHMMEDLNAQFTDGKTPVTCYTCHHGESAPKMEPPAETAAPK